MAKKTGRALDVLAAHEAEIVADWIKDLKSAGEDGRISDDELHAQAREFAGLLRESGWRADGDLGSDHWANMRSFLEGLSRVRVEKGFDTDETAGFIFSVKKPIFARLRKELADDPAALAEETWAISGLIDRLGLFTVRAFQKTREEVIRRQQEEMLELSTPVVKLWDGVLALPMIGTLDSARTQLVMESLLQRIVETGAEIAIIDITGVPTVDTLVAQHLMKTVTAIRLMGSDCIISGIRPQIAQTIVHLGVDLRGITTKSTLADALTLAFRRLGMTVVKAQPTR